MVLTDLAPGANYLEIEWDIRHSGVNAIDFITHYDRLEPHAQFNHTSEVVDPLNGLTGISSLPITYPIPAPLSNKVVACTGLNQPITEFNSLPSAERVMTMFNGVSIDTIYYVLNGSGNYGDLNASSSASRIRIEFTTSDPTVVFAWGGHIASIDTWCPGNAASGISGSPYHTRLGGLNGSGGGQDRSLSASAVIPVPPCDIDGDEIVCAGSVINYSKDPFINYTYTWSLVNNTSGASIIGSNTGSSIDIQAGSQAGAYTIQLVMSGPGYTGTCTKDVVVKKLNVSASASNFSCSQSAGSVNVTSTGGTSPYSYFWNTGQTTQNISGLATGNYTVTVTDALGCVATATASILANPQLNVVLSKTDAGCFGESTGSVTSNVSGGQGPYSYQWSIGSVNASLNSIPAGSYTVTVTDVNGCTATASTTVSQPSAALNIGGTIQQEVSCFGGSDGSINITVSGGTAPYSYNWSDGSSTQDVSGLSAGSYTVTITDANSCVFSQSFTVTQPAAQLSVNALQIDDVSCFGFANGAIDLNVSGGTSPYAFQWSGGETTEDITGLSAGTYTVTVTDSKGCSQTASFTVDQPAAALSGIVNVTSQVSCYAGANGSATVSMSGGTSPYSYQWSNGSSSQSVSGLSAGNYTVTVTDVNGCSIILNTTINQPLAALSASISASNDVSCHGGSDGSINVSVSGGTTPYVFSWNNGANTEDITGLNPGTYALTVTDANGCTATVNASISQPSAPLSASTTVTSNISCFSGNNGAIDLTVAGGTPAYTYLWSTGATTEDVNSLPAGNYNVTVTDANGCITTTSAVIVQPAGALSTNVSITQHVSCFGGNDGAIDLTVSGGTTPYIYTWSNGASTQDLSGLSAGSYTVTISDANGCNATQTATITQPQASLSASASTSQDVSCFGGIDGVVQVTVTGGTAPYSYNWSNGATSQSITGLISGNYTVNITDANGCTAFASATVGQPAASLSVSVSATQNISCYGLFDGSIDMNVSGGTAPYSYNWSNGSTTQDVSGLSSGTYTVTVTDDNGCTSNQSVTLTQPSAVLSITSFVSNSVSCFGGSDGSIDITVNGGTQPYSFQWSNGSSSQNLSGVSSGIYTVTVSDVNGCSASKTINISQPSAALSADGMADPDVFCFGANTGSVQLTVSGGTMPYSFLWNNGSTTEDLFNLAAGTYIVTVTDANGCVTTDTTVVSQPAAPLNASVSSVTDVGCYGESTGAVDLNVTGGTSPYTFNWSNGALTEDITGLATGTYTVIVTDANGCSTSATATVGQPQAALSAQVSSSVNVSCFGGNDGSIQVQVSGGTQPYTYLWNTGASSPTISGLSSGTYSVTVTDAKGCTTQISSAISQPAAGLSISVNSAADVLCYGGNSGSINVTVSGGTVPYTYNWSNGANTQDISGLSSGTYTLTVTDAQGCVETITQTISQPVASLAASTTVTSNISCFSGNNGSVDLTVNGGTSPYSFVWSTGATTEDISGLAAGTYSVTITDANGCTTSTSATITQPAGALSASLSVVQNVSCNGGSDGSVALTISGGTTPYVFQWSNGASTQNISNVPAGTYTVTITDANGCNTSQSTNVSQPAFAISISAYDVQQVLCNGGSSAHIDIDVFGGTLPYSFVWSNGATTEDISGISSGIYTVTVTDANGCTETHTEIITEPSQSLSASVSGNNPVSCYGGSDGSLTVSVTGGTPSYTFEWNTGALTQNLSNVSSGTYTLTVTDANGCTTSVSASISQPAAQLQASINVIQDVSCYGGSDAIVGLNVSGGTTPYSYQWSNGATSNDPGPLSAGTYTVTITDVNSCTTQSSVTINQPAAALNATISGNSPALCFGDNTGSLSISVSGGTSPYSYVWNNGATSQNINNLVTGTYTVTITDSQGCTFLLSDSVSQPSAPLSASTVMNQAVSCFGGSDGSGQVNVTGGTSPYTYTWSHGVNTQQVTGLSNGTYDVTVTDANGCSTTASLTITEPNAALNAVASMQQAVNCHAGNDGSASVAVSGGTAPYSYQWSDGSTTSSVNGLSAGIYTVTVTDINGCITSANVTITQPQQALSTSVTSNQAVSCFGGGDGSLDVLVTGGTSPYTFQWNTGATTQNISGLSTGTYTVTVTDVNGCTDNLSATVSQPAAALNASTIVTSNISCYSGNNGSINLTVSGGTLPYTFIWSTGATTEDINGVGAGVYTVTITDANGCTFNISDEITQPAGALSASLTMSQAVSCNGGSNGALTLTVNGGTAPYSYNWSNGATTQNISGLSAGVYTVTVTDANGCFTSQSGSVTQPVAALSISTSQVSSVLCHAGNSGAIDITPSGGTAPYTYVWSNGQTTQDISGLTSGTYTVTVTDANGCIESATISVNQPAAPLSAAGIVTANVSCYGGNNGSANISVSGGTVPYSYQWSNGEITQSIFNLSTGLYSVTITDANGCTTTASVDVLQPFAALNDSIMVISNALCFGDESGTITYQAGGGTAPYSYQWSNGATTSSIDSLLAGTYTVTVTDANGCVMTSQATISQPPAPLLALATVTQNVFCNGGSSGSIDLTANGGTQPYTYVWNNGATTEDINGLSAGTYTATVTDANGCTATASAGIGQPAQQLTATVNVIQDVLCFNGTNGFIDIMVTGGTPAYTFNWSNGATTEDIGGLTAGTYTVTVTDANGCDTTLTAQVNQPQAPLIPTLTILQNVSCFDGSDGQIGLVVTGGTQPYTYVWSTGDTTQNLLNIPAGSYTVTVTDENGCNAIISDLVVEPTLLTGSFNMSPVLCHGDSTGSLSFNATGGTPGYSYLWSTGDTTASLNGLPYGTYMITVTDANGCIHEDSMLVTQPQAPLALSGTVSDADCLAGVYGGVSLTPTGGTPSYTFSWSNGDVTQNLGGVMAGNYTVVVTDANGCSETMSFEVGNNSQLNVNVSSPEICIGDMATLTADSIPGGLYQWYFNGAPLIGATSNTFTTPAGGYYYVTIETWCGSFMSDSVQLTTHSLSNISISNNQIICPPESVTLNASGGTTYEWSPSTNINFTDIANPTVYPTQNTTYSVVVTNEYGCSTTLSVDVMIDCDTLLVPTGFSPNDDGVNDGYVIDGIDGYPGNRIWVYNRWGNLVFKTENYNNYWDGVANVKGIYFGEKLPSGTYFYILDLNDNSKPRSGYLIIRR
jgi:gliding motility-associated-like protein